MPAAPARTPPGFPAPPSRPFQAAPSPNRPVGGDGRRVPGHPRCNHPVALRGAPNAYRRGVAELGPGLYELLITEGCGISWMSWRSGCRSTNDRCTRATRTPTWTRSSSLTSSRARSTCRLTCQAIRSEASALLDRLGEFVATDRSAAAASCRGVEQSRSARQVRRRVRQLLGGWRLRAVRARRVRQRTRAAPAAPIAAHR